MHCTAELITAKKFNNYQVAKFPVITLLLAEDDAGDIELTYETFARKYQPLRKQEDHI